MEESAEHFCNKSWFQIGESCKTFLQDSISGKHWCADASEAHQVERRRQLSILLRSSPTNRVGTTSSHEPCRVITCDQVRNEIQAYIEARRSQFAFLAWHRRQEGKKKRQARERRWEGQERQRSGPEPGPESEFQSKNGRSLLALWKDGSLD